MNAASDSAHLSIGEVLAHLSGEFPDVTISKIRFLESQGLIAPERTPSGYRKFYESDLVRLRWILLQQKDNFLPLKVIKDRLLAHDRDGSPLPDSGVGESVDITERAFFGEVDAVTPLIETLGAIEPEVNSPKKKQRKKSTRQKVERNQPGESVKQGRIRGEQLELDQAGDGAGDALTPEPQGSGLTRAEIAEYSGVTIEQVAEMEACGLIKPAGRMGSEGLFDDDARLVAALVAGFMEHGAEPRHLRMYRNFAVREAQFYEQMVAGSQRQTGSESRLARRDKVVELASLGRSLRTVYLRRTLDEILRAASQREEQSE